MLVEFGNPTPTEPDGSTLPGPAVTYFSIPDERTLEEGADVGDVLLHLARNPGQTSHLPGLEALLDVVRTLPLHMSGTPSWVWSDNPVLAQYLSEFFDVPIGRPGDVESTHHTLAGPPGVAPRPADEEAGQ